jgi:glycosyltransferase involved in cell wall biosynthesis
MIVPFFPPNAGGGVYRPLSFVKYLGKYGWQTTVVTPQAESFWITDPDLLEQVPPGCDVRRTRTLSGQYLLSAARGRRTQNKQADSQVRSSRKFSMLRKIGSTILVPDTYIGWYPFAVREGRRVINEKKIDAIYSTSPPETSHLVAKKLHAISRIPWVADFRDPWMNLHLFPPPTRLHKRIHRRLERSVCERAAAVVTNRWHLELLENRYSGLRRVTLIPNGYDPAEAEAVAGIEPPREGFRIVHAGMLTQKRSAEPFLKALRFFIDANPEAESDCRVVFLGPRESDNDREVERLGLGSVVTFRGSVAHHEALKIEKASHILLLIKHENPDYAGIIPGKLFEYIGLQRPILALVPDGEAREIVTRLNRGTTAPVDDPEAIARALAVMYEKHRQNRLDPDYDLTPVDAYRRDVLAGRLAGYLDSILDRGN